MHVNDLLKIAVDNAASDLHLKVGSFPMIRVRGVLRPATEEKKLDHEDVVAMSAAVMSTAQRQKFKESQEVDLAYSVPGLGRFRCNIFQQRGTVGLVLRVIPMQIRSIVELGLPPVLTTISEEERGLVLVTGTTGSGKSTTLAAMIDHINKTRQQHIVTIEDPIEILHADHASIVNQREVGLDTTDFQQALRRALRQDPDVILIGELRDAETAQTALQAAESGHLVMSTLHTVDVAESVGRLIEFFPAAKQQMIRSIIAGVLRGVVSQRLLPKLEGGRVAAIEVMVMNNRIAELIRDDKADEILDAVAEGQFFQMQTFTQALIDLVVAGQVDPEVAANASTSRHDFLVSLDRAVKQDAHEQKVAEEATKQPEEELPGLRIVPAGQ